jgi:DNA-binding SARP family transcriptional activator
MATLLDEAESVWRMMPPSASVLERFDVVALRVRLMSEAGRLDDASATLQQFAATAGSSEAPFAPLDSWIAYLGALLAARRGQLAEAERVFAAALPMVANVDLLACETFFVLGAEIARVRGQRALERQFLDRADDLARRSSLGNVVALVLAEAAFGAWLAGEDAVVSRLSEELADCVRRSGVTALKYLSLTLAGGAGEPERADAPRHVALARVIAAARHAGDPNGARYAREARQAARAYHSPFVECLAELCTAFCEPEEFDDAMLRAADAAGRCDSPALRTAVEAIARREEDCGMLDPFAQRFARARRGSAAPLDVELAAGAVRVHGRETALAGREAELLFALASRREATARTRLAALLWPETGEDAARNALSVCLHRLRRSLGADAVVRDGDGYRLGDGASVDLWDFERKLAAVRDGALDESGRAKLGQIATQLEASRPDRMERWEWFAPVARRLDAIRVEVAQRLGIDALERGDPRDALERAAAVLAHDPFDEPAREMIIRAHLALDDRAAALRSYRQYREMLRTELQCEPSPALTRMVNS